MADLTLFPGETLLKTISAGPGLVVDLIEGEAHGEARMALRHVEKVINPEAEVIFAPCNADAVIAAIASGALELSRRSAIRSALE